MITNLETWLKIVIYIVDVDTITSKLKRKSIVSEKFVREKRSGKTWVFTAVSGYL